MSQTLSELTSAVEEALGDLAVIFPTAFIQRALNAGQARYEPELLRQRTTTLTWADDATTATLPTDFVKVDRLLPGADYMNTRIPEHVIYAGTMLFRDSENVEAWSGTLLYRAHYPTITEDQDCLLTDTACDGLVSFALHRCYRRLAAGRSEYKRYSTIVGSNAVSVAELEQMAQLHLQDYEDGRASGIELPPPAGFYP